MLLTAEEFDRLTSEREMVGDRLCARGTERVELERGVRRTERKDPMGAAPLRVWLDEDVRPMFDGRTLPVDERTAIAAATPHVPDPMPVMDALIAATTIVHDLTLVTHNTGDFQRAGRLFDPWDAVGD